jgi:hypothetical protein
MSEIYTQPITAPCAWTRADIVRSDDWQHELSGTEIDDLDRALKGIRNPSCRLADITRDAFPLPVLASRLAAVERDVRVGRGFFLLRGIPVERYTDDEVFLLKWGIGTHLGRAISQNVYGDMLGHVFDHGNEDPTAVRTRGYQTSSALDFHVDLAPMPAPRPVRGHQSYRQLDVGAQRDPRRGAGDADAVVRRAALHHHGGRRPDRDLERPGVRRERRGAELLVPARHHTKGDRFPGR